MRAVLIAFVLFFIVPTVCCLTCIGMAPKKDHGAPGAAAPPPETDHDHLVRATKSNGPYAIDQAVRKMLKAPSQAKFSHRKLLEQSENFAFVSASVDAPNSFGVMLRSDWCAIIQFVPPRGEDLTWFRTGVWECSDGIKHDDLLVRKAASGWPGAAAEVAAIDAERRRRR